MLPRFHLSIERWKKNEEFGVWVSTMGRARLIKNKKYLEPRINEKGYCFVFTEKGCITLHRLVAYTWLGDKRNEKYTIDHIDSNKRNNCISNLRWVPEQINQEYASFTKVTTKELKETVPAASVEQKENLIDKIYNSHQTITKRVNAFRLAILNKQLKVVCDGAEIGTFKEMFQIRDTKCYGASNEDFLYRVLMSIKNESPYAGCNWSVKIA